MLRITPHDMTFADLDEWPADVDLICSALAAALPDGLQNRRQVRRRRQRIIARLSLFCGNDGAPITLYSRDCDARHMGFITQAQIPLGYGGTVDLVGPDGQPMSIGCMIYRCRECVPGWFEGVLNFNRPQPVLKFG